VKRIIRQESAYEEKNAQQEPFNWIDEAGKLDYEVAVDKNQQEQGSNFQIIEFSVTCMGRDINCLRFL